MYQLKARIVSYFAIDSAINKPADATEVRLNICAYAASRANDGDVGTYWTMDDFSKTGPLTIDFGKDLSFNRVLLQEFIALGQRVEKFQIEAWDGGLGRRSQKRAPLVTNAF